MKRCIIFMMAIVLLTVLSGCLSMVVPEKLTADDCLVIIKTQVDNPDEMPVARNYYFKITGYEGSMGVTESESGNLYIVVRNNNTKIEAVSTSVMDKDFRGDDNVTELDIPLPYAPGKVIVFDLVFVQKLTRTTRAAVMVESGFEPITDELREKTYNTIATSKAFESWR